MTIDVSEFQINLKDMIPNFWNVGYFKVISKVIHQEVDLSLGEQL
jgi:hypothetical protein